MSQQIGGYPPPATGSRSTGPADPSTTQVARDEAADVGRTAADAGRQVAGTAADQAGNVVQEVRSQARDLVGEARGQVRNQAVTGQQKAADAVRTISQELREMADNGQQSGTVSEIARQAAQRGDRLADWIGEREPADLLEEVRTFARRRPGAFLLGAAVAGVVVGRLTRGAVDSARADAGPAPRRLAATPVRPPLPAGPGAPPAGRTAVGPGVFDTPTPPHGQVPPAGTPRPYAPPPAPPGTVRSTPPPPPPPPSAYDPPGGRHTLNDPDDVERAGDPGYDDPFRPGPGSLR